MTENIERSSSESETSDDEEIDLTDEEKYNIVEYYWDPKNTHVGQWVDPVDVEKYIHAEPKVANYKYQHLHLKVKKIYQYPYIILY